VGYGLSAKAVKAAIDGRNARRELERERQAIRPKAVRNIEAPITVKTKRLEEFMRKPWRLTT
jgi:hypothetical protein